MKSDNGKAADLKALATREPFRPFGVRLTNGARYDFKEPRDFGATKNFHAIVYFDNDGGWASIYVDEIAQIFENA